MPAAQFFNQLLRPRALLLGPLLVWGCSTPVVTPTGAPLTQQECVDAAPRSDAIFLIGDAGAPKLPRKDVDELVDPVLMNLHEHIREDVTKLGAEHVAVIFLGDNVYWDGIPPEGHSKRRRAERILEAQIAASAPARAIFKMGNHDWHVERDLKAGIGRSSSVSFSSDTHRAW